MIKRILFIVALFVFPFIAFSQEEGDEDEKKMVREVINVMVDKAKFAPPPAVHKEDPNAKKGKKKHHEEPPAEAAPDTGASTIPAPITELYKRASNWGKSKHVKYTKSNAATAGTNVSCSASFVYKQKQLNPENEVDGQITMDIVIEAKEGKYRYTIKNIKHVATKQGMSGGDIYLQIPECGSMKINDQTWKHIKAAAFADIQVIVDDLKSKMKEDGDKKKDEW